MPDLAILPLVVMAMALVWFVLQQRLGFMAQRSADYAGTGPAADIRHHLNGPIECEGVIYGPTGRVTSRFTARMEGRWNGSRGTLDEHFAYAGGNTQTRQWRLSLGNDGAIHAEADDVVGHGVGQQEGASVRLSYRIRLPRHAGGWALDVTDWMYVMENGTIINRSQFRKFGIKVAELVATMRRVQP
ncbi:MAG: Protein of unknown function (DUF3833) [Rhodobacteraceae bacterium HLUCCA12]|nr:MAG: Protein of unknown function (DUF3833) [Rhodobacteraceae bacterium HLUCCA12]